jgi:hypothetical protein
MKASRSTHRHRRRWWLVGTTLAVAAAFMALFVVTSGANLAGSTFEGNDGNLVVNTTGNTDWANAPSRVRGDDLASGGSDNSFGQGTKEDDAKVSDDTGSIPPQKSDLTRFYVGSEFVSNSNFLYLAWERSNVLGSANMDFELNQKAQPNLTTTGPKTLVRTAGDILITFDFGGSGTPVLGLLKWVTSGATSQCFASNSLPCWGNRVNLSAAGFAEGAVNSVTVTDPIANVSLPAGTFGEAAINLTAAGVFPAGTCEALGSVFLKSRSSASFPAEVKDFVAPQPVNITNCGTITIHKVTQNGDASFGYTTTGGLSPSTFNLSNGGMRTYSAVLAGSYSVTESTLPTDWTFVSLVCTASGTGTGTTTSSTTANITLGAGGAVDCTYTNKTKVQPAISTAQNLIPNDDATISGATASAGGTITFSLFSPADATCAGTPALTQTVNVSGNGTYSTTNTTFIASTEGTWRWQVVYSGDANNFGTTSACGVERFTIANS